MKILVLTSVYPQPDDDKYTGVTPVVHYYAKEWAKAGHDVLVIHNANKFILPVYHQPTSGTGLRPRNPSEEDWGPLAESAWSWWWL